MAMKIGYNMKYEDFLLLQDDWALYRVATKNFQSWVYHTCNPVKAHCAVGRFLTMTELKTDPVHCWKCHHKCSPEILGLWRLHNFDAMSGSLWIDWKELREYNIVTELEWL
jgi:hypothetical protein